MLKKNSKKNYVNILTPEFFTILCQKKTVNYTKKFVNYVNNFINASPRVEYSQKIFLADF